MKTMDDLTVADLGSVFQSGLELLKQESALANLGPCVDLQYLLLALEELANRKPKGRESTLTLAELVGVVERAERLLSVTN